MALLSLFVQALDSESERIRIHSLWTFPVHFLPCSIFWIWIIPKCESFSVSCFSSHEELDKQVLVILLCSSLFFRMLTFHYSYSFHLILTKLGVYDHWVNAFQNGVCIRNPPPPIYSSVFVPRHTNKKLFLKSFDEFQEFYWLSFLSSI